MGAKAPLAPNLALPKGDSQHPCPVSLLGKSLCRLGTFALDGGLTHFLEGRMDASFGTTPTAMLRAIRLIETGLIDTEKIISHRFPLAEIHQAMSVMGSRERNKVVIHP